jgi:signal transduction histidine kinase
VEALLLGTFAVTVHYFCKKEFYNSFDSVLQANAEAIATLVEEDHDEHHNVEYELEFADEVMNRFSRNNNPDLFAVILNDGKIFEKSVSLNQLPEFVQTAITDETIYSDFQYNQHLYRGIIMPVVKSSNMCNKEKFKIYVFFAASIERTYKQLDKISEFLGWFFGAGLLFSGVFAGLVVWRGLIPLRRLAYETGQIREDSLNIRLKTANTPSDLMPLADSVNNLLERLENAFKREKQFSSDAAHELRTPVATLKSGIQAALLTKSDQINTKEVLSDLLEDVIRLENLCSSLLLVSSDKSRPEGSGISAEDFCMKIKHTIEDLRLLAESQNCILNFSISSNVPKNMIIKTNDDSTYRIVRNLVENAIFHGGPQIDIQVSFLKSNIELSVRDNGSGVVPEDVPKLFERFFRPDKARSRATGGAGLGLAICKTLAESWGGSIKYESVSPKGSIFTWKASTG